MQKQKFSKDDFSRSMGDRSIYRKTLSSKKKKDIQQIMAVTKQHKKEDNSDIIICEAVVQ